MATDVQPQSLPLLSASTTGASTSATSTVPAQSIERERFGSRDSWTVRSVTGMQAAAIAASIQNRPCQPGGVDEHAADERPERRRPPPTPRPTT